MARGSPQSAPHVALVPLRRERAHLAAHFQQVLDRLSARSGSVELRRYVALSLRGERSDPFAVREVDIVASEDPVDIADAVAVSTWRRHPVIGAFDLGENARDGWRDLRPAVLARVTGHTGAYGGHRSLHGGTTRWERLLEAAGAVSPDLRRRLDYAGRQAPRLRRLRRIVVLSRAGRYGSPRVQSVTSVRGACHALASIASSPESLVDAFDLDAVDPALRRIDFTISGCLRADGVDLRSEPRRDAGPA